MITAARLRRLHDIATVSAGELPSSRRTADTICTAQPFRSTTMTTRTRNRAPRRAMNVTVKDLPRTSSIVRQSGHGDAVLEANRILRLSDRQLAIVRQAAVPLSPSARDRYLKTVAAELAEAERVDDATVKAVVETVLCTLVDR